MATGYPMIGWGIAWLLGLGALDLLSGPARILLVSLAWIIGMLMSWLPIRSVIKTGSETRVRWAWAAVLVSSPFLISAAQPASFAHTVLFLCGLWGLAMCLYAIAVGDRLLVVVTGIGIGMAGVLAAVDIPDRLLWCGVSAGLPMLALGLHRVFGRGSRV